MMAEGSVFTTSDIAKSVRPSVCLSVRLSVCPSVRHTRDPRPNDSRYRNKIYTYYRNVFSFFEAKFSFLNLGVHSERVR